MVSPSVQNLLLALIVVVPGFVATHFAISLGVVRTELSKWRLLIISLTMSLLVVTLFLAVVKQIAGETVTSPTEIGSVFFNPVFRPDYVIGLLLFSGLIGTGGAIILTANIHKRVREAIWDRFSNGRTRNFHEPWEGSLDKASRVQILTSDGAVAVGSLWKYSDDGKEKQISLTDIEWTSPTTEGWVSPDTDMELFFGDDIRQVTIVDTISEDEDNESGDE